MSNQSPTSTASRSLASELEIIEERRITVTPDRGPVTRPVPVSTPTLAGAELRVQQLRPSSAATSRAKRRLDIAVSATGLLVLSPVLALVGAAVRYSSPGPALFRQERVGLCGREFTLYKFRTMVDGTHDQLNELLESSGRPSGPLFKVPDDPRITGLGRVLRKTSIDELPQLLNVLRGEMSLVGPRPQISAEVAMYDEEHFNRLRVRPGLTGLWQVHGRSDLPWEQAVKLDLEYVRRWSMRLDLKVLVQTLPVVLSGRGAE